MYREKLDAYLETHLEEMLEDICAAVRINSQRGDPVEGRPYGDGPAEALDWSLKRAEELGFSVRNYENYVGTVDLNDKERHLDILAHLDIVPFGDNWTVTRALDPVVVDGKIYGRGTADDKGPAMAALYAMRAVKELGIPLSKNVRLILGTDEECGSSDLKYYYGIEEEAPMSFSPDCEFPVINVEKGGLRGAFTSQWDAGREKAPRILSVEAGTKVNVIPGEAFATVEGLSLGKLRDLCRGAATRTGLSFDLSEAAKAIRIHAKGQAGHAAQPWDANNALTGLLDLLASLPLSSSAGFERIKALHQLFPHGDWAGKAAGVAMEDEISGPLTICLNMLQYKPGELAGQIDSRISLCATRETMEDVLRGKLLEAEMELDPDCHMYDGHHVPGDAEWIQTLLRCYEDYTGLQGECLATGGGTYVHDLKNGVAFGCSLPGTDNHMHGADEFAVVEELLVSAKIFAAVIVELCK